MERCFNKSDNQTEIHGKGQQTIFLSPMQPPNATYTSLNAKYGNVDSYSKPLFYTRRRGFRYGQKLTPDMIAPRSTNTK